MNLKIKISIIVPIYNVEKYLKECLESLINQTLPEIEIILINDASPDNSILIMQEYENNYPNKVKCIYLDENLCQGGARNKGLDIATGEYIMFVDSDDSVDITICEKLYLKAISTESDIVFCDILKSYEGTGKKLWFSYVYDQQLGLMTEEKKKTYFMTEGYPVAKVIRRSLIEENKIRYPEHLKYEDLAIGAIFYLYSKRNERVKEHLYIYNIRDHSTSQKRNEIQHYDFKRAAEYLSIELIKRGFSESNKEEIDGILIYGILQSIKKVISQFDSPDLSLLYEWCSELIRKFPNYRENRYYYYKNEPLGIIVAKYAKESEKDLIDAYDRGYLTEKNANYDEYYIINKDKIDKLLEMLLLNNKKVAIWGAGKKGTDFLRVCDNERRYVLCALDKDEKKCGTFTPSSHKINKFVEMEEQIDVILVMNKFYFTGIREEVNKVNTRIKVLNLDVYILLGNETNMDEYFQ